LAKLSIVGVGPGSPDYVTPAARKTVQESQVVIGAQRSLNLFQTEIQGETIILTAKNLNAALKQAVESVQKGKKVALLSTGDPGFSGLLKSILNSKLAGSIELNVIPAVSSIQACAAKLCISWDEACLFSFHEGNVSEEKKAELASCLKAGKNVMLLPDSRAFSPKQIASYLINLKFDPEMPVCICENMTLPDEKVTASCLREIVKLDFAALCVMVIKANSK
jgi:cobalt-precorrin-7 (C5)-methyltransferase